MGSMLLKVICGTMFLLGMSWNVMAKEVIKGRVVDSQSKEVLIGATVSVEGTSVGCATDAEGYFELEVEESGTVILVFRCVGYSEVKKSVVVDDAIRAVKLITGVMANAIVEANGGKIVDYTSDNRKEEKGDEIMQKALETVKRKEDRRPRFKDGKKDKKSFNKSSKLHSLKLFSSMSRS